LWCIHREFSYESIGERILKIGPQFPQLLSNIKGYSFFVTQCSCSNSRKVARLVVQQLYDNTTVRMTGQRSHDRSHNHSWLESAPITAIMQDRPRLVAQPLHDHARLVYERCGRFLNMVGYLPATYFDREMPASVKTSCTIFLRVCDLPAHLVHQSQHGRKAVLSP